MDVFTFRDRLVSEYQRFTRSFVTIRAPDIKAHVDREYEAERFWPAPMIQLNPAFVPGGDIGEFVAEGLLHPECERIFRFGKTEGGAPGKPLTLHRHQEEAIRIARLRESYVLTTGTGSGKSLAYFVPIVDDVLRRRASGGAMGISAIVVYPMNALCNSQMEELEKYLRLGYPSGGEPVRFARYTGQESTEARQALAANPPDILLTNYVMLELMLTRHSAPDPQVVEQAKNLRFLVLDELHTYRGRQGADVAMLVRRVRDRTNPDLLCVGTSATMATEGTAEQRNRAVANVASLQAGHLNDFVMILLLRGALLAALRNQPDGVLTDDTLTHQVLKHLRLSPADYASSPEAKGAKADGAKRALRDVLGYRTYFDLRRGWRFTHPNLEQLGYLAIGYSSLEDCAADQEEWSRRHPLLAAAMPAVRESLLRDLLDRMRRGLCIKTIYLDANHLEQVRNRSFAELKEPWGLAEDERPITSAAMIARPQPPTGRLPIPTLHISHRSAFGRRVKAKATWETAAGAFPHKLDEDAYNEIVDGMLGVLGTYGLAERLEVDGGHIGYRVPATVIEWRLGSKEQQDAANRFFLDLYHNVAEMLRGDDRFLHALQAREHTAQVDAEERERREEQFREASLPVLFCSPTMELGVDIATLNTVYMRNVPPTPANYAQRSGRAGRSGQPALVLTYCAARSPHDQYFFRNPVRMVAGAVNPPALDLANEDLIRSHLHAVWLGETGQKLGPSVQDVLDRTQLPDLPLVSQIAAQLDRPQVRQRAAARGIAILQTLRDDLRPETVPWFTPDWLDHAINSAHLALNDAFDRWRTLFNAAQRQMTLAHNIQINAAADEKTRREAQQRYNEARIQRDLLLDSRASMSSDFYAYRYLASEGFLPGYNFPRLPLLAYIPARREKVGRDSFLSRPRFLGLSEFGPRSIIYHEGSTYRVRKAILSIRDAESVSTSSRLTVRRARLCPACGYGHFDGEADHERCVNCDARLDGDLRSLPDLYRIDQVSTRRADRITSDEEERQRQGYEVVTTLRFAEQGGKPRFTPVVFAEAGDKLLSASYGPAATVWRINLGWRRRKNKSVFGFNIDVATGEWCRDEQAPEEAMDDAPAAKTVQRITPFVEDRRNVLVVRPEAVRLDDDQVTTLTYALKRGIERVFQLEESELAAEPLPDSENRNAILLYEAAEGGAGVLSHLASDPAAIRHVARRALEVCHWTSRSGLWADAADLDDADPDCEAACYRCLLSYSNQPDHRRIDRRDPQVLALLCRLARADTEAGNAEGAGAEDAFASLGRQCGSGLERAWLDATRAGGFLLPDRAQPMLHEFSTQPDFAYERTKALIYVDGPHHRNTMTKTVDDAKRQALRDAGYKVVVFAEDPGAWPAIFARFPFVFGKGAAR